MTNDPRLVGDGELPVQPVACCWETSQGEFHNFLPARDAATSKGGCARMNQTFHLLYAAPVGQPAPDLAGVLEALEMAHRALRFKKGALSELSPCMAEECNQPCIEWRDMAEESATAALAKLDAVVTSLRARMGKPT